MKPDLINLVKSVEGVSTHYRLASVNESSGTMLVENLKLGIIREIPATAAAFNRFCWLCSKKPKRALTAPVEGDDTSFLQKVFLWVVGPISILICLALALFVVALIGTGILRGACHILNLFPGEPIPVFPPDWYNR